MRVAGGGGGGCAEQVGRGGGKTRERAGFRTECANKFFLNI